MKAYTGTGDKGDTGLYDGTRVGKENPRVEAYGAVDELTSQIGVARALVKDKRLADVLRNIQEDLFILSWDLSTDLVNAKISRIGKSQLTRIESVTDEVNDKLPSLKRFIFPGGSLAGAELHVARAVCRRAERRIVTLSKSESINPEILPYINRLSSLLFVLARSMNKAEHVPEEEWVSR